VQLMMAVVPLKQFTNINDAQTRNAIDDNDMCVFLEYDHDTRS